jgi:Synergist-CTERM protein sorting domain-containing protein
VTIGNPTPSDLTVNKADILTHEITVPVTITPDGIGIATATANVTGVSQPLDVDYTSVPGSIVISGFPDLAVGDHDVNIVVTSTAVEDVASAGTGSKTLTLTVTDGSEPPIITEEEDDLVQITEEALSTTWKTTVKNSASGTAADVEIIIPIKVLVADVDKVREPYVRGRYLSLTSVVKTKAQLTGEDAEPKTARGAAYDEVFIVATGTASDEAAAVTEVSYIYDGVRYVQEVDVPLTKTALDDQRGGGSSGGGCDAGFGAFALAAAAAALVLRKKD